uniref:FKBP prolyl isomerase like n=1 Tax=Naja naja TaxID=35670 RepID=A0A8C6X198_NAJNA
MRTPPTTFSSLDVEPQGGGERDGKLRESFLKSQTAGERETGKKPDQRTPICDKNIQDASLGNEKKDLGDKVKENQPLPIQSQPGVCWPCPDGTFVKLILKAGTGLDKPKEGSFCQVFIEASHEGPLSYPSSRWAEVELGGGDAEWDGVVDRGLETMLAGERAELRLSEGGTITVQLASFTEAKDSWEMSASEKWDLGGSHCCSCQALCSGLTLAYQGELHTNLAACQLRLHQPANAAQNCSKTLVLQPANPKALFRRGLAYDAMNDLEGAAQDLKGVLQVEPGNRAARRELDRVTERIRARDARLAQAMQKMFA